MLLVRALESIEKWDKDAIKVDKHWGWDSKLTIIGFANRAAEHDFEVVLKGTLSMLRREQYDNPALATIFCKSISSYLTRACIGATKKRDKIIQSMTAAGIPIDEAESKVRERTNYAGAIDDVTDPQYQASLELIIEASEELHSYLNEFYVVAEANAFSRSRRIGCLPWSTVNIGDEFHTHWLSCVTLDHAMSMAAKAEFEKAEREREQNASSAKNMDEDFA